MKKLLIGIIGGIILLLVAAYFYVAIDTAWMSWAGTIVFGLAGIAAIIWGFMGMMSKGGGAAAPQAGMSQPQQPQQPPQTPPQQPPQTPPQQPQTPPQQPPQQPPQNPPSEPGTPPNPMQ